MAKKLVIKTVQPPAGVSSAEFEVDVEPTATVAELKAQITGRVNLPKENIRLVCAGRIWTDTATVGSYEPRDGAMVHCLNNPPRATPAPAAQQLTAADPMQQLMGGSGLRPAAVAGGDPMSQMMAQAQQQFMQDPEMVRQIMDSPMVQQLMSNPETIRAMMRMNPQLNQLMEQRPEIARLLEDPDVLQQSMQMMRNPALMQEMTRNADRAIGHLDVMPGGHSALVQAHQDFADPLFQALSGSEGEAIAANAEAYNQQTEGLPNNEALPNPWGAPGSAPTVATPAAARTTPPPAANLGVTPPAVQTQPTTAQVATPAANPANPMAMMMQQMMSNPQQMQQMMAMSRQMFGGGMNPGTVPAPMQPAATPAAPQANPIAAMMQQMMSDPAMMQQSMDTHVPATAWTLDGNTAADALGENPSPAVLALQRARFAQQLAQLTAMGFGDEIMCLRALARHNGRIDAAIDSLLSSGQGPA